MRLAHLLAIFIGPVFMFLAPPTLAQDGTRYPLWPNGAPGFESRAALPEESAEYWTKHINNPSITYFPARAERATGAAVLIIGRRLGVSPVAAALLAGAACLLLRLLSVHFGWQLPKVLDA